MLLGLMENALTNGDAGRGWVRDGDIPWFVKSNKLLLNPLSLEAELLSCEIWLLNGSDTWFINGIVWNQPNKIKYYT